MDENGGTTRERILDATLEMLGRSGPRKLSLSDVATTAGVSRPTLYRWFPSKDVLLEAFGRREMARFDQGIAAALEGIDRKKRLEAILRFIVEFQHSYSLRRIVDVDPEYAVQELERAFPIVRERLLPCFPGKGGFVVASTVARIALSHAMIPDADPALFLAELRSAARLDRAADTSGTRRPRRRRRARAASRKAT